MKKASEIFEGENSSLRKTYEEAFTLNKNKNTTQEMKEKHIGEILNILAWQQVITNQGDAYVGEKDWALNKILSLIDRVVIEERERIIDKLEDWQKAHTFNALIPQMIANEPYLKCLDEIINLIKTK